VADKLLISIPLFSANASWWLSYRAAYSNAQLLIAQCLLDVSWHNVAVSELRCNFQEMDEKQHEVLQKCHDYLIDNIDPSLLIDKLYTAGILTRDDTIRLRREVTPRDQNRLLLVSMLPQAGPTAFCSLLAALKETNQSYVSDHLLDQFGKGTCVAALGELSRQHCNVTYFSL